MRKQRVFHPSESREVGSSREKIVFMFSKFKISFYSKIELDDNTRKIIKFVNSMQGI